MAAITADLREFQLKDWPSAMDNRTGNPRPMLSTLLNLAGFGLAAATSIVLWGIASFSFLDTKQRNIQNDRHPRPVRRSTTGASAGPVEAELRGLRAEAAFSTPARDSPAVHDTRPWARLVRNRLPSRCRLARASQAPQEASLNSVAASYSCRPTRLGLSRNRGARRSEGQTRLHKFYGCETRSPRDLRNRVVASWPPFSATTIASPRLAEPDLDFT
jgi:hypothetical protein